MTWARHQTYSLPFGYPGEQTFTAVAGRVTSSPLTFVSARSADAVGDAVDQSFGVMYQVVRAAEVAQVTLGSAEATGAALSASNTQSDRGHIAGNLRAGWSVAARMSLGTGIVQHHNQRTQLVTAPSGRRNNSRRRMELRHLASV